MSCLCVGPPWRLHLRLAGAFGLYVVAYLGLYMFEGLRSCVSTSRISMRLQFASPMWAVCWIEKRQDVDGAHVLSHGHDHYGRFCGLDPLKDMLFGFTLRLKL